MYTKEYNQLDDARMPINTIQQAFNFEMKYLGLSLSRKGTIGRESRLELALQNLLCD